MDSTRQVVDRRLLRIGGVRSVLVGVLWIFAAVIFPSLWGAAELAAVQPRWHVLVSFGVLAPMATVGALLAARLPAHPVGWLLLVCAASVGAGAAASHWTQARPEASWAPWAGWVNAVLWAFGSGLLLIVGLLFPDGRPWGRAGRWGMRAAVTGVGLLALGSGFTPGPLGDLSSSPGPTNPLGITALAPLEPLLLGCVIVLLIVGVVLGVLTLASRWRQGRGQERLALAAGGAPLAVALALEVTAQAVGLGGEPVALAAGLVSAVGVPVGIGVAVTRYRLYDLDLAIAKTLGYTTLALALATVFAGTAAAVGLVAARGSPVAAAAAAGVTAIIFAPARARILTSAQRTLLGVAGEPELAAALVARRLAAVQDPDLIADVAARAVAEVLRLPVVLVLPGLDRDPGPLAVICPMSYHGVGVGALGLASPAGASVHRALSAVGEPVAAALHAATLTEAVRHSRIELISAVAEERRRLRRDLHDGLGPNLATLAMGLDAVANQIAGKPAGTEVDRTLTRLREQADQMLTDLRQIVRGLRPPALDELGLIGALRLHAAEVSLPSGLSIEVVASDLGPLGAALEVTAYLIAAEALLNAARHSAGRHCWVTLSQNGGLHLSVADDGLGIPAHCRTGVGTQSMRERAAALGGWVSIAAVEPHGTQVRAWLPAVSS